MNRSLISICIPTYNGQEFLGDCLDSAIGQSYNDIEIIVVDDCSTDNTLDIITNYAAKDSRIKLFRNEKNLGLVGNWNKCIELSKGEWIKLLFQDDYLDENSIDKMVSTALPMDRIVASKRNFIFESNISFDKKEYYENEVRTFENSGIKTSSAISIAPEQISSMTVENICLNFIGEPTFIMFRRDVINEVGLFNPDLIQICDLEYFLRIGTKYGIKYIPESLASFRIHNKSTSASNVSSQLFTLNNIETIVVVHQLLFASVFNKFRGALSWGKKMKLTSFFEMRVYESYRDSVSNADNMVKFEAIEKKYPEITRFKRGTISTRILVQVIKIRRLLRK